MMSSLGAVKEYMFLGPVSYVNHSCEGNTQWYTGGKKSTTITTIARANIQEGQEITTHYGQHYFDRYNKECRCIFCMEKMKVDCKFLLLKYW